MNQLYIYICSHVSMAVLDANGCGSDLIQREYWVSFQYLESVFSAAAITLSIYIISYLILTTNLWDTCYSDLTEAQEG